MANKKFSEFTVKTSTSDVDFVVGYDGTDNVRITPANLTGGGGASSLNGLTDCLVDTGSLYVGEVPSGLSGNPQGNTVLGIDAGNSLTTGNSNIAIGFEAARDTTTTNAVIAIGSKAGRVATTGIGETIIIGNFAMNSNTGASKSVIIGGQAGWNASGGQGVSIGYLAAPSNTNVGHHSIGYQAGYSQTSGSGNTNIGYKAGYGVTTGGQNTLIGYEAGVDSSLVASGVVALGYQAGKEFESGDGAVLIGRYAGAANGSAKQQTVFIGDAAGRYISSAFNTAVGAGALRGGTTSGSSAGYNTAVGTLSLKLITTGDNNVSIGANAGDSITTGSNLTIIGYDADASSATATNEITLGNSSITSLRCAVTSITSLSDERDKSDIKDLEYGLAFIDALQPREFVWDNRPETRPEFDEDGNETEVEFYSANKGKKDFGFIAQEVRELDNDTLRLVYTENEEKLELSYGKLVPILVKAIQELKEEVELLKS